MKEIISQIETEIEKLEEISSEVVWHNDRGLPMMVSDKVENFLILHKARMEVLLYDLKKLLV